MHPMFFQQCLQETPLSSSSPLDACIVSNQQMLTDSQQKSHLRVLRYPEKYPTVAQFPLNKCTLNHFNVFSQNFLSLSTPRITWKLKTHWQFVYPLARVLYIRKNNRGHMFIPLLIIWVSMHYKYNRSTILNVLHRIICFHIMCY